MFALEVRRCLVVLALDHRWLVPTSDPLGKLGLELGCPRLDFHLLHFPIALRFKRFLDLS